MPPRDVRLWIVGLGTVGQWLLHALHEHASWLESRYAFVPRVVGAGNTSGFVYDECGLDPLALVESASEDRPLVELPGAGGWPSALEGLEATEADVLVEVAASPAETGEPGAAHLRAALGRAIPVVTSNKWPVALYGVELARTARAQGVQFRAESTVMSGTPVLRALVDGLAGTTPVSLRGVVNATANFILTRMEEGASYEDALGEAQALGLAERDPTSDLEGIDAMAKAMILAALVFEQQLRPEDVARRGIAGMDRDHVDAARADGTRVKEVVTLGYSGEGDARRLEARIEPTALPPGDPLAGLLGVTNGVVLRAEPIGEVVVTGPGAGPRLAGQGVLSDLIEVARA
jgi:homoserine dehydrogenase